VQRKLDTRTSLVSVEGELDLFTAPSLKRALVDALEAGSSRFVVDLSLTTFIDSTTLGVLVGVTRRLEDGARLAIVCSRPGRDVRDLPDARRGARTYAGGRGVRELIDRSADDEPHE
jgi:anti-anti-sigma factor